MTEKTYIGASGQKYVIRRAYQPGRTYATRGDIVPRGYDALTVSGEKTEWAMRLRTVRDLQEWIRTNG